MNNAIDEIMQAALALPEAEQLQLLAALSSSLDERGLRTFDDAWMAEIRRRSAEFDAGGVRPIPWSEVKERARREIASGG